MVEQVAKQIAAKDTSPDACIAISTEASLKEMILPGILVSILIYSLTYNLFRLSLPH